LIESPGNALAGFHSKLAYTRITETCNVNKLLKAAPNQTAYSGRFNGQSYAHEVEKQNRYLKRSKVKCVFMESLDLSIVFPESLKLQLV
jgi:hypothetical protein